MNASEWLLNEDAQCFESRLSRLNWLDSESPAGEYWTFPGGMLAQSLFEEARYSFVYGQFLATSLLGLAYIERTLAALFYQEGRNDLERASLSRLLREAYSHGLLGHLEMENIERIRRQRNLYAHFRKPGVEHSIERRSVMEEDAPYNLIERDATEVMKAVLHLLAKSVR